MKRPKPERPTMRNMSYAEAKIMYKTGNYTMAVPAVTTGGWDDEAWMTHIFGLPDLSDSGPYASPEDQSLHPLSVERVRKERWREDSPMLHGYVSYWQGRKYEVYATSLLEARDKLVKRLGVPKGQRYQLNPMLCERNVDPETGKGEQVVHSTAAL